MTRAYLFTSIPLLFAPLLLTGCQQSNPLAGQAQAAPTVTKAKSVKASAANPIVVELYQSQGCSSCPPANSALNAQADRADVIALNFSVTYWDRLGWKDVFGDPKFTQRQYDYASALREGGVYTPQMVINGRRAIVGNSPGELDRAIAGSSPVTGGPAVSAGQGNVTIAAAAGKSADTARADIWLVRYDARIQNVAIKSGENSGRTLPHKNIVRQLVKLGGWNGKAVSFALPANPSPHYRNVILVQRSGSGPIISARRI
ncbi:MAG: DUF1223 domain-containing protein [Sphingorhabdus sp.]|nr:DUF1223 domain-containing protein [Sphingorhabdus sp.]